MIEVNTERLNYRDTVVLTVDEMGIVGLARALADIQGNRTVRSVEMDVSTSSDPLRLRFECKADRQMREKREADEKANRDAELAARAAEKAGVPPVPEV